MGKSIQEPQKVEMKCPLPLENVPSLDLLDQVGGQGRFPQEAEIHVGIDQGLQGEDTTDLGQGHDLEKEKILQDADIKFQVYAYPNPVSIVHHHQPHTGQDTQIPHPDTEIPHPIIDQGQIEDTDHGHHQVHLIFAEDQEEIMNMTTGTLIVIRVAVIKLDIVVKWKERRHVLLKLVNIVLNQTPEVLNKDQNILQNITQDIHINTGSVHARSAKDNLILAQIVEGQGHGPDQEINVYINRSGREQI